MNKVAYLEHSKKSKQKKIILIDNKIRSYTLSRKIKKMNREEENREERLFFGALDQKTGLLESKPRR